MHSPDYLKQTRPIIALPLIERHVTLSSDHSYVDLLLKTHYSRLLRRVESNHLSLGYEPNEMPFLYSAIYYPPLSLKVNHQVVSP